jgi:hypothetical protein
VTVNEAIERAGSGFILEGVANSSQVIGFEVLSKDGNLIARFNCAGIELALSPVSDADTSNP